MDLDFSLSLDTLVIQYGVTQNLSEYFQLLEPTARHYHMQVRGVRYVQFSYQKGQPRLFVPSQESIADLGPEHLDALKHSVQTLYSKNGLFELADVAEPLGTFYRTDLDGDGTADKAGQFESDFDKLLNEAFAELM